MHSDEANKKTLLVTSSTVRVHCQKMQIYWIEIHKHTLNWTPCNFIQKSYLSENNENTNTNFSPRMGKFFWYSRSIEWYMPVSIKTYFGNMKLILRDQDEKALCEEGKWKYFGDQNSYWLKIESSFEIFWCQKDCEDVYWPCINHCGEEDCFVQCGNELGACKLSK